MKEIYAKLITDFHKEDLPKTIARDVALPILPKSLRKAFVFIGMRRSGKTWLLFDYIHNLLQDGLEKEKIVYINFEDDRLVGTKASELQYIIDAYFELYPQYYKNNDLHFFLDEIQEIDGWEKFVRRLLDTTSMQVYITGSSAKMLSKEIASSLRGRTIVREVFPFSFSEYIKIKGVKLDNKYSSQQIYTIKNLFNEYMEFGGFPEIINLDKSVHLEIIQGYVNSVIFRDIVDRYNIGNTHSLRIFIKHALQNAASLLSINKLYNFLKTQGVTVGKNTLYDYIKYLEDAHCVFVVPSFNLSLKKAQLKPQKIYVNDQGLIRAYSLALSFDKAALLENLVFTHLRRNSQEIFYYNTKNGKEVDFLVIDKEQKKHLFQVTLSIKDATTKKRELSALKEAMIELGIKKAFILTLEEEETLQLEALEIVILPVWKYIAHIGYTMKK